MAQKIKPSKAFRRSYTRRQLEQMWFFVVWDFDKFLGLMEFLDTLDLTIPEPKPDLSTTPGACLSCGEAWIKYSLDRKLYLKTLSPDDMDELQRAFDAGWEAREKAGCPTWQAKEG